MPQPAAFIVGRQAEVLQFDDLLHGRSESWLLNIYGPGGIGKTVVGQKMRMHSMAVGAPVASVDGSGTYRTAQSVLAALALDLSANGQYPELADALRSFVGHAQDYGTINAVLDSEGGVPAIFSVTGAPKNPARLAELLEQPALAASAAVHAMPLPELAEVDAKAYLRHHGLSDSTAIDHIYQFTGGYPLLLVLVRHLAQETGSWAAVGAMERSADRDAVAGKLLERILREERVQEVRVFLEQGVVAEWFDPETISELLEVSIMEGRRIYDLLQRHSFVERHEYGLKFHDKIRELLQERLKFTSRALYDQLQRRLRDYYARKSGSHQIVAHELSLPVLSQHCADLEIWLQPQQSDSYAAIITFQPPGSPVDEVLTPGDPPRIEIDATRLRELGADQKAYSTALSAMIFADQRIERALLSSMRQALGAGVGLRLRIRLAVDDPAIHALRWELLRDPIAPEQPFLGTQANIYLSRYLASSDATPVQIADHATLTALLAVAAPDDLQAYRMAAIDRPREIAAVRPTLAGMQLTVLEQTTLSALMTALLAAPTILYLVCHGAIHNGEPYLWLEDNQGHTERISGNTFVERIRGLPQRPVLIVLAACQSAGQSQVHQDALVAIGPRLAQAGVGAVIAMHDTISMQTLQVGMPIFFDELRRHGQVDRAVTTMRTVLAARSDDWWQLVLFLRLRDGRLWR
jgi:hypothetical protein